MYNRTSTLVVRQVPRGLSGGLWGTRTSPVRRSLSGILDSIESAFSSGVTSYNATEQQQGALAQAQRTAIANQSGGIDSSTLLLLGVGGLALMMILKKKKAA